MEVDRDAVLQTFLVESGELLDTMEQDLVSLEARPGDAELIDRMFRSAHTVKGTVGAVDQMREAQRGRVVEDLLEGQGLTQRIAV
jgi:two-component system, chemotaxis family, sensor kinase CheA